MGGGPAAEVLRLRHGGRTRCAPPQGPYRYDERGARVFWVLVPPADTPAPGTDEGVTR
ncbi:hypothetical protein [Staphylococcus aureus]|uniref:hypothetical protein n=1 Tax=Staphylococcus aureus TaxID=1280 RepID=UPI0015816418